MTVTNTPPPGVVARARQLLKNDPVTALANYTWINNVTVGAPYCRFAFEGDEHCLAHHLALPFPAISLESGDPAIVSRLLDELIPAAQLPPDQPFYSLVPARLAHILTTVTEVLSVRPEWLMLHNPDLGQQNTGSARLLEAADLPAMIALARAADAMVFGPDTFARGAFFGIDSDGELIAMGGVQNELSGFSEIGSIVTHPAHRRQGHASQIVSALTRHLHNRSQQAFLVLFQANTAALALYQKLRFEIIGELKLIRWRR
ncbi:MAG TPA: GNAT family N-acetyltransferase [Caldilineae bacterium]|nr:GNAT family N-acetyltransferase [Caldilineae bacterium]